MKEENEVGMWRGLITDRENLIEVLEKQTSVPKYLIEEQKTILNSYKNRLNALEI